VTLRLVFPPDGDIEMTITSRGLQRDEYYLQRVTLRWVLPFTSMKYYQFRNRIHVTKLFYKLEYVSYLI
jgi:hypothetical protein